VSIDITKERVVTFREAAKHYCPRRRRGRKPHISTFYRWADKGLETIQVGGQRCTSVEALQRFFDRSTEPSGFPLAPAPTTSKLPKNPNTVED
jgi:hypothetical protein